MIFHAYLHEILKFENQKCFEKFLKKCKSKDMANFHHLQGKLKPLTLIIKCLSLMDFTEIFKFN